MYGKKGLKKMKKCNICKEYKSLDNFHKDISRKDNLAGKCKQCKSMVDKKYAEKYKEKRKAKYYKSNYYSRYKVRFQNYSERRRELHTLDPRTRLRGGAKGRAKKNGIEFNLPSYKDLPKVPKYCPILGIPLVVGNLKNSNGGGTDNSPSLDRTNNDKGYIKGNIQIISRKANQMKSNATLKEIGKLYNYMNKIINKE